MCKKLNKNGMTLIEIIVVMLISSMLLAIIGGLILSSMGYFNKTATANLDKQALDGISSYVRNELVYASDVKITQEKPEGDDWHWFSLNKDTMLLHDDKVTFNKDFYNKRILKLLARIYKNDYRMDLSFTFQDTKDHQVYKSAITLELINMKSSIVSDDTEETGKNGNTKQIDISFGGNKIYYKKGTLSIEDEEDLPPIEEGLPLDGTVAEEIRCKSDSGGNNKGEYSSTETYSLGDFVYMGTPPNETWYRVVGKGNITASPDDNGNEKWKKIDKYWDDNASYKTDDVIVYPATPVDAQNYYRCKKDIKGQGQKTPPDEKNSKYWEFLGKVNTKPNHYSECEIQDSCDVIDHPKTVEDEICERDSTVSEPNKYSGPNNNATNNKGSFTENLQLIQSLHYYKVGDFVLYDSAIWRKVWKDSDISERNKPDANTWWKKIQLEWDSKSFYDQGDVVLYTDGKYYKCKLVGGSLYCSPTDIIAWKEVVATSENTNWIDA